MNYYSIIWKNSTTFCLLTKIIGFCCLAPPRAKSSRVQNIRSGRGLLVVWHRWIFWELCQVLKQFLWRMWLSWGSPWLGGNFNWGFRRKLNVSPAFVNVCCFLIFPLLTCVSDSTLGIGWLIGVVHYKLINIVWSVTIYQMITPALGKENKLANNVTVLSAAAGQHWTANGTSCKA